MALGAVSGAVVIIQHFGGALHLNVHLQETRSVGIRIYKAGHWGSAGGLGQVTHHDGSNSRA